MVVEGGSNFFSLTQFLKCNKIRDTLYLVTSSQKVPLIAGQSGNNLLSKVDWELKLNYIFVWIKPKEIIIIVEHFRLDTQVK